jgi:glycolate oxidase iron-sulfur subunit
MQTNLANEFKHTQKGKEAESILRKCVHCGFCTATCPTYQILGDELDGPRGRIYLIKQMLEGEQPTQKTQLHLDRCLTCRNCETTCPSGVQYSQLLDIGREIVESKVPRSWTQKIIRNSLRYGLTSPLFGAAMRVGQFVRPLLPSVIKSKVPVNKSARLKTRIPSAKLLSDLPSNKQVSGGFTYAKNRVLLLAGCVQPAMAPNVNLATARTLDAMGYEVLYGEGAGCCGALAHHLSAQTAALDQMRKNIDVWWPLLNQGVQALVMTASGCGASVKEYGHLLANDPLYAAKAQRVAKATVDLSEWIASKGEELEILKGKLDATKIRQQGLQAYHPPCTLQHGQKLKGGVETVMADLGFDVRVSACEPHLCCGSAGAYSVLNPGISNTLKDRKLGHLKKLNPKAILSANVGCIAHLQSGTDIPVHHWIEVIDLCLKDPL